MSMGRTLLLSEVRNALRLNEGKAAEREIVHDALPVVS